MTTENNFSGVQFDENSQNNHPNPNSPLSGQHHLHNPMLVQFLPNVIKKAKMFWFLLAYFKVVASIYVLVIAKSVCDQPLRPWLILMMGYDFMAIVGRFLQGNNEDEQTTNNTNNLQQGSHGYVINIQNESRVIEHDDEEGRRLNSNEPSNTHDNNGNSGQTSASPNNPRKSAILKLIEKISPWLYIFLFFYGNVILISQTNCLEEAPMAYKLVRAFVIFQVLAMILPLLLLTAILIACCGACINLVYRSFREQQRKNETKNIIKDLPMDKYPLDLAGDHECSICLCAYSDGDDIIKFTCSKMHHFHGECIKKWLLVNDVCPICRKQLQDMKFK